MLVVGGKGRGHHLSGTEMVKADHRKLPGYIYSPTLCRSFWMPEPEIMPKSTFQKSVIPCGSFNAEHLQQSFKTFG